MLSGKNLDTLEQKLTEEYKRFSDLEKAIDIQNKHLEELYEITKNSDSLAALLLAQKEYKARFEKESDECKKVLNEEISQKKIQWKKEQEDYDIKLKEQLAEIKKKRERDEEEYQYATKLTRKKDQDAYETKKDALEKDLEEQRSSFEKAFTEREKIIAVKEETVEDLHKRVEQFPKELDKAVKDAEKNLHESLERTHKHQMDLLNKDIEGERKLNNQTISMLQIKIREQEEFIKQLTSKTNLATNQVQEIALKALESPRGYKTHCFDESKKPAQTNTTNPNS